MVTQVFSFRKWLVLVDEQAILTGLLTNSTSSLPQAECIVALHDYGISHVRSVLWFTDQFGARVQDFWAVWGTSSTDSDNTLFIFEVQYLDTP